MAKRNQQTAMRNGDRLGERLNDYSAVTRISAAAKSVRGRVGNWPIYAAAAGSALAMATNASASIIYCGVSNNYCESVNQHPVPTETSHELQVKIPLLQSGTAPNVVLHHVLLSVAQGDNNVFGVFFNASALGVGVNIFDVKSTNASSNVKNFVTGASVGPHLGASTILQDHGAVNVVFTQGGSSGNFRPNVAGLAGFEITGGNLNQTDYGWIRLVFTDNQAGDPVTLTAVDWAFDTTGASIEAGVGAPEPGTMALSLLALGAAGVAALKRRRSQTPA